MVRKVYTVSATSVLDSNVSCVYELAVYCCFIFCCSFCCHCLFVSFTGTIHQEGSSPSFAEGGRLGGFLHHHEMLLDNLRSLYTTVRVAPQAAGFCRSWRFDFLAQNSELLQSNNCLLGCERVMETRVEFHCSWVYNEGFYPDCLKVAKVIPIYKYGEQKVCSNYRPISILLQFNKIFERILYDRVYFYLQEYKLLSKYQFGFRPRSSTSYAVE